MNTERLLIRLGFVMLCIVWGSTWLAIKIGLDSVPPFFGVALRFTVAAGILYLIMRIRGQSVPRDKDSWKLFGTTGLLSFGIPFSIIYWSEQFLPSGLMSILFAIFPFVVALISHFSLPDEPLNAFKISGIVLGFAGIFAIFSSGLSLGESSGGHTLVAMIGVVASTFFQASSAVYVKRKGKHMSPITLNCVGMAIGVVPVLTLAFVLENVSDIRVDAKAIGSILYLGTCGSVLTFVTYFWLLKRLEVVYLSFLAFVTPVVAVLLGAVILSEQLESNTFLGAALVLIGILVANLKGLAKLAIGGKTTTTE